MKVKIKDNKNWDCAILLEISDSIKYFFFRILANWQHMLTRKDTRTQKHTHLHSKRLLSKSAKQICLKTSYIILSIVFNCDKRRIENRI